MRCEATLVIVHLSGCRTSLANVVATTLAEEFTAAGKWVTVKFVFDQDEERVVNRRSSTSSHMIYSYVVNSKSLAGGLLNCLTISRYCRVPYGLS